MRSRILSTLVLGLALMAPSISLPPDVHAIACTNPTPPQSWHYKRVNPDGSVYFESQAWDMDYNYPSAQRVALYMNGKVLANVVGVLRYTVPASAAGYAHLAKPDWNRCGAVVGWVAYGHTTVK